MANLAIANPTASGLNGATTGANDTSTATLLIMSVAWSGVAPTIADSKSNTWVPLTVKTGGASNVSNRLYYCLASPVVGTGHTFSATGAGLAIALSVEAHDGGPYTFVSENGAAYTATVSVQPGAPSGNSTLMVTGISLGDASVPTIGSGFTIATFRTFSGGSNYGASQAYLYQALGAGVNPTWGAMSGGAGGGATIAAFAPGGAVATKLGITGQPTTATSGVVFGTNLTVAVQDAGGSTVVTDTSTVALTLNTLTGSGVLTGTTSKAAVAGIATFNDLVITGTNGSTFTITATDGVLTSATTTTITLSAPAGGGLALQSSIIRPVF